MALSPAPISSRACWPFSGERPLMTTLAPSARKASAMARPIPRVPPVIAATLPSSSMCLLRFRRTCGPNTNQGVDSAPERGPSGSRPATPAHVRCAHGPYRRGCRCAPIRWPAMGILCGHCGERHATVAEVRQCSDSPDSASADHSLDGDPGPAGPTPAPQTRDRESSPCARRAVRGVAHAARGAVGPPRRPPPVLLRRCRHRSPSSPWPGPMRSAAASSSSPTRRRRRPGPMPSG